MLQIVPDRLLASILDLAEAFLVWDLILIPRPRKGLNILQSHFILPPCVGQDCVIGDFVISYHLRFFL
ncbi:hypothetical protein ASPCADRAFT_209762 [Aspergillus carbonarius ITEM 5010]|uniref:Uncharacterized protein n=1 Tax=Aspergillus carbonarius (strain ITEM 5010) TaxID=602072 RepID=A0A1R3RFA3_ASPC5|nr:hypothetical protein ASPCADRAFT_209762 [Aspergillus carbonarius ITEM 5010]